MKKKNNNKIYKRWLDDEACVLQIINTAKVFKK